MPRGFDWRDCERTPSARAISGSRRRSRRSAYPVSSSIAPTQRASLFPSDCTVPLSIRNEHRVNEGPPQ